MPRRRASSGYRVINLEKFRLARDGEQFGYAVGHRPMDAQRLSFVASRCSRSGGFARIVFSSSAERRVDLFSNIGISANPARGT
jgi:hypothetical protein